MAALVVIIYSPFKFYYFQFSIRKKVREANEDLWDAAENNDIPKIKRLLDKNTQYPAEPNSK